MFARSRAQVRDLGTRDLLQECSQERVRKGEVAGEELKQHVV